MSAPTIAVWFSNGAASAVAAMQTLEQYSGTHNVRIINNPVLEEHEDNLRFKHEIESALGIKIETATNPKYPDCSAEIVWRDHKFMSGPEGARCTLELKKKARYEWERNNHADHHVLGFTADEKRRHENFIRSERLLLPVLIESNLKKSDCIIKLADLGVKQSIMYDLGYPNANCIGCCRATSPTYWNHVRRVHPKQFAERAETSRVLGVRLARVKGVRVFLDELDPNAIGRPMKSLNFECGIFCEELQQQTEGGSS